MPRTCYTNLHLMGRTKKRRKIDEETDNVDEGGMRKFFASLGLSEDAAQSCKKRRVIICFVPNDTRLLSPLIGKLKNLRTLLLHDASSLVELPVEIGNLTNLVVFELAGSAIMSLPASIGKLQNLEELYLSELKALTTLPEEIGNLTHLKKLYLNGSGITILPESFHKLSNLSYLNIHATPLFELQVDPYKYLFQLTQLLPTLVSFGLELYRIDERGEQNQGKTRVRHALACNRARSKLGMYPTRGGPPAAISPDMWPLALEDAEKAFSGYELYFGRPRKYWIGESEAIYQLLTIGRESFLGVLLHR